MSLAKNLSKPSATNVILQRDISRLANRLYQETVTKVGKKLARRVPENVIERDYVLA